MWPTLKRLTVVQRGERCVMSYLHAAVLSSAEFPVHCNEKTLNQRIYGRCQRLFVIPELIRKTLENSGNVWGGKGLDVFWQATGVTFGRRHHKIMETIRLYGWGTRVLSVGSLANRPLTLSFSMGCYHLRDRKKGGCGALQACLAVVWDCDQTAVLTLLELDFKFYIEISV